VLRSKRRGLAALLLTALAVSLLGAGSWSIGRTLGGPYARPAPSGILFRTLGTAADFAAGMRSGVKIDEPAALVLDPTDGLQPEADTTGGLRTGADAAGAYNGGTFLYGTYLSPIVSAGAGAGSAGAGVDQIVASWCADTPEGTWLQVDARALQDGAWTKYYTMGVWASGTSTVRRHNAGPQEDADGLVDTDILKLKTVASALQLRATLFTTDPAVTPRLRRLSVVATGPSAGPGSTSGGTSDWARGGKVPVRSAGSSGWAWGASLAVPERRQNDFPDGAGWCSPTSLSMLMAFWARQTGNAAWDRTVPETAAGVTDYAYGGAGNWTFNTAYAASLGFDAYVTRFGSLAEVERWIEAGVPVAINIAFEQGELDGAPMPSSDGHVIVIRGFSRAGDPIANDPAARADQGEKVRIVYDRGQLERAWLGSSSGTTYVLFPPDYPTP